MDLGALKIFLAVAQERSFSRAAAKVHRTQPAVSQAVRRLEVELGEQLFDRSSKTGTLGVGVCFGGVWVFSVGGGCFLWVLVVGLVGGWFF